MNPCLNRRPLPNLEGERRRMESHNLQTVVSPMAVGRLGSCLTVADY